MHWSTLASEVRGAILGILGLLAVSTLIVRVLCRARPEKDWTEIRQRVKTWWMLAGIFLGALVAGSTVSILLFAFLSFLGLKEFFSLISTRRVDRRVLFWAYLAIPVHYYWVHIEWYGMFIIFVPVYVFLLLPMRMISIGKTDGYLHAIGTLHWGLMTMVYSISHAAYLLVLRLEGQPDVLPGPGLVLLLVGLTQLNDVAQFLWGKSLGKRKIIESVSPGKTWAGFVGGVATTVGLAALTGPWLTPMNVGQSIFAGVIIGVGGFVGDVCISALKRDLKIKDSGHLLPGHGGILDRIDSLTYTSPLFFHYVYWLLPFEMTGS